MFGNVTIIDIIAVAYWPLMAVNILLLWKYRRLLSDSASPIIGLPLALSPTIALGILHGVTNEQSMIGLIEPVPQICTGR